MRAERAAEDVVRRAHIRDPVAHRLVDGVLQRSRTRADATHLRAQQAHPQNVQLLPAHVLLHHVDDAFEAQQRTHGGRGDAVLARAGLSDDALFAHAFCQQTLAERVVDLVRAGVQQVLALQVNLRAAELLAQPLGEVKRSRPADVMVQQIIQLRLECSVFLRLRVGRFQLFERRHQSLRNIAATIDPKPAATCFTGPAGFTIAAVVLIALLANLLLVNLLLRTQKNRDSYRGRGIGGLLRFN